MRRKKTTEQHPSEQPRPCDMQDCAGHGEFKAPRDRNKIGSNKAEDYYFFCTDHIVAYNKSWDFFDGMDTDTINAFRRDAITGHRPTWASEKRGSSKTRFHEADLWEAMRRFEGGAPGPKQPKNHFILSAEQEKAFATLQLDPNTPKPEIKRQYKSLVKQLHPDVNHGSKQSEERFKQVTEAYRILQQMDKA